MWHGSGGVHSVYRQLCQIGHRILQHDLLCYKFEAQCWKQQQGCNSRYQQPHQQTCHVVARPVQHDMLHAQFGDKCMKPRPAVLIMHTQIYDMPKLTLAECLLPKTGRWGPQHLLLLWTLHMDATSLAGPAQPCLVPLSLQQSSVLFKPWL